MEPPTSPPGAWTWDHLRDSCGPPRGRPRTGSRPTIHDLRRELRPRRGARRSRHCSRRVVHRARALTPGLAQLLQSRSSMRRRIRSAAFPVRRHSVPQLLVDGLLVALAYFLAYRLRFENHVPGRYERLLRGHDPLGRARDRRRAGRLRGLPAPVDVRRTARVRGSRQGRDRRDAGRGGRDLLRPPCDRRSGWDRNRSRVCPAGVIALFFLLTLTLLLAARFAIHLVVEGRVRTFRAAKGARDVLIVGRRRWRTAGRARAGTQPAAADAAGGIRRRRPSQAQCQGRVWPQGAGHHLGSRTSPACLTRPSRTRS